MKTEDTRDDLRELTLLYDEIKDVYNNFMSNTHYPLLRRVWRTEIALQYVAVLHMYTITYDLLRGLDDVKKDL